MGYNRGGHFISKPQVTHSADMKTSTSICGRKMKWGKDSFLVDDSTSLITCTQCRKKLNLPPKTWNLGKWYDGKILCPKCKGAGHNRATGDNTICKTCDMVGVVPYEKNIK